MFNMLYSFFKKTNFSVSKINLKLLNSIKFFDFFLQKSILYFKSTKTYNLIKNVVLRDKLDYYTAWQYVVLAFIFVQLFL